MRNTRDIISRKILHASLTFIRCTSTRRFIQTLTERHLDEGAGNMPLRVRTTGSPFSSTHPIAGRRICPGSFMAEKSLFTIISRIVWAFRINAQGIPVEVPLPDITVPQPSPPTFKARFVPRHDSIENMCRAD
ncbi:hypothetical protein BC936DRAFT_146277 [Jimgerdemannia flammicorona]|uniref:Cytochrome P450 n=1 Tax=Jimgerdemannia flammicorona TaxID=994334 RepID=A0A433D7Z7_9FUNG|nr:hypothetical protein BC936DRAFT_146277 [Jimgerdemannia flammicorona]